MKRLLVAIIGIPLLLGGIALILIGVLDEAEEVPTATRIPASSATRTASPAPTTSSPRAGVCGDNPAPATSDTNQVDTPATGDAVASPVNVSGRIAAFEAVFQITIFDAAGEIVADQTGHADEGQTLSPFSEDVPFTATGPTLACIWVYEESARDGNPIHIVQIPVVLQP